MKIVGAILCLLLAACSGNSKQQDLSIFLKKEVLNKETGVVFRIPENWGVLRQDKNNGSYVASKYGHGFEECHVGKMVASGEIKDGAGLDEVDSYFLSHGVKKLEQNGKIKFLEAKVEKLPGIIMGGTHGDVAGGGIVIHGFVKNIAAGENQYLTVYMAYSADVNNTAGMECSVMGTDRGGKFLKLFNMMTKTINYRNEYYQ